MHSVKRWETAPAAWTDGLLQHNRKSEELGRVLRHLTPGIGRDASTPFDEPDQGASQPGTEDRAADIAAKLPERRRLLQRARRLLTDSKTSAFLFVLTPKRLPVLETCRAISAL